jgi:hypothetical protein
MSQNARVVLNDQLTEKVASAHESPIKWCSYIGSEGVLGSGHVSQLLATTDVNGEPFTLSTGPWWIDANHASDYERHLSLIFFSSVNPILQGNFPCNPHLLLPALETIHFDGQIKTDNLDLKGAEIVFWFQARHKKTQQSQNYALTGYPVKLAKQQNWTDFKLKIDFRETQAWTSLGSHPSKSNAYLDLPIESIEDNFEILSIGLILYPLKFRFLWPELMPQSCDAINLISDQAVHWPVDSRTLPSGTIAIRREHITYSSYYALSV